MVKKWRNEENSGDEKQKWNHEMKKVKSLNWKNENLILNNSKKWSVKYKILRTKTSVFRDEKLKAVVVQKRRTEMWKNEIKKCVVMKLNS